VTTEVIRAAGGVVVRRDGPGRDPLVALVHRPKYDDWSFPKGKLYPGEDDVEGAIREVREETGLDARIERDLGEVRYADRFGRPKAVRYFLMTSAARTGDGTFVPTPEVDEVRWLSSDQAADLLSYDRDAQLLRSLIAQGVA
jgi:8-oxo-dGTP diphosphatase